MFLKMLNVYLFLGNSYWGVYMHLLVSLFTDIYICCSAIDLVIQSEVIFWCLLTVLKLWPSTFPFAPQLNKLIRKCGCSVFWHTWDVQGMKPLLVYGNTYPSAHPNQYKITSSLLYMLSPKPSFWPAWYSPGFPQKASWIWHYQFWHGSQMLDGNPSYFCRITKTPIYLLLILYSKDFYLKT